jgi:hypothetical protein
VGHRNCSFLLGNFKKQKKTERAKSESHPLTLTLSRGGEGK